MAPFTKIAGRCTTAWTKEFLVLILIQNSNTSCWQITRDSHRGSVAISSVVLLHCTTRAVAIDAFFGFFGRVTRPYTPWRVKYLYGIEALSIFTNRALIINHYHDDVSTGIYSTFVVLDFFPVTISIRNTPRTTAVNVQIAGLVKRCARCTYRH